MKGQIKRLFNGKGFGFIEIEDQEEDAFLHTTECLDEDLFSELSEGDMVEFEIEETEKGPKATQVTRA